MDEQERVAAFLREHDLEADPAYRVLDLAAEVGELAADAAKSADYGADPDSLTVSEDELGDALFALLAVAEAFDADAGAALEASLAKYEHRLAATGDPGSEPSTDADPHSNSESDSEGGSKSDSESAPGSE